MIEKKEEQKMQPAQALPDMLEEISDGRCENIDKIIKNTKLVEKIGQKMLDYKRTGKVELSGLSTGYAQIDDILDGLQKEQFILLAARTGMGKTWVALNFLINIAVVLKIPVALFSLEMSHTQILYRLISLLSGVPVKAIKNGTIDEYQQLEVEKAVITVCNSPISLSDDPKNSTLNVLKRNVERVCKDNKAKIVIVDHIGLVYNPKGPKEQRANEMSEITRTLKIAAKTLEIPIMCVAQLNRNADNNEKPKLSHLRESGSLEQDADVIIFIHRSDYYEEAKTGEVDIIIAKNRDGEQDKTVTCIYSNLWRVEENQKQHFYNKPTNKEGYYAAKAIEKKL